MPNPSTHHRQSVNKERRQHDSGNLQLPECDVIGPKVFERVQLHCIFTIVFDSLGTILRQTPIRTLHHKFLAHLCVLIVLSISPSLPLELHLQGVEDSTPSRPDDRQYKEKPIETAPRMKPHSLYSLSVFPRTSKALLQYFSEAKQLPVTTSGRG